MWKHPPEVFYKKTVIKKLATFTEKYLCWSPFLIQNIAKPPRALWKTSTNACFWNCVHETEKIKIVHTEFWLYVKEISENLCFYFMKETSENSCFYFMIGFPWILYLDTIFLWCDEKKTSNNKCLLELIKRKSKDQEKNMSCECDLNFDQWKT